MNDLENKKPSNELSNSLNEFADATNIPIESNHKVADIDSNNYGLYASYYATGIVAHCVGYMTELTSNYALRRWFPESNNKWLFFVVGKIMHEGVENMISSGSIINLMNLESFQDSLLGALKPIYAKPGQFLSAAVFSYSAEKLLGDYMYSEHNHGHGEGFHNQCHGHHPTEIALTALISVVGTTIGIDIYDYFFEG